jgi:hypothetical protein
VDILIFTAVSGYTDLVSLKRSSLSIRTFKMGLELLDEEDYVKRRHASQYKRSILLTTSALLFLSLGVYQSLPSTPVPLTPTQLTRYHQNVQLCKEINERPGPSPDFLKRTVSDRYDEGIPDVWIRNATVWTGNDAGKEILLGADVYLSKGIITKIQHGTSVIDQVVVNDENVNVINAFGAWVTPGLVSRVEELGALFT